MSNGDEVLDRNWPTEDFVDVDERISNLQQSVDCLEALVLHISNANLQVSSNSFTFSETSSQLDSDTESDDTESSGVSEDEDVDESDYSQKSEDSRESDSENGSDEGERWLKLSVQVHFWRPKCHERGGSDVQNLDKNELIGYCLPTLFISCSYGVF